MSASPEAIELIRFWIKEGYKFRSRSNTRAVENRQEYLKRVNYELEQIIRKDFVDYFLMLSDAVRWAKGVKIPVGPARGSAAASLVCYLLRITEVDPMQFPHMLFARFIDPNRLDLPDVDLDFADDRRDEVRMYLVKKYGAECVGNIGTFTRYKGKNSIDDIARVYRIPAYAANTIKELIVERSGGDARQSDSLEDTFDMFEKAREMRDKFPQFKYATRLEGNYKGLGVHAAGLVISNAPISDTCAVYTRPKANSDDLVTVVAYDKYRCEYLGMLKADFLGLKTMGMIGIALDIIGMDLEDLYRVPIDEPKTIRAFRENDLAGIFQFDGRATAIVNADVVPEHFEHLADINALSRPGPLFSGMTAQYVNVKHERQPRELLHPVVDDLTEWTYGQIVYQEQVLSIVKDLAGFPIERVGDIRRIISQKLGNMAMANALEEFIDGCRSTHGIEAKLARRIWDYIATSSTYSFNQSHSVSYALLGFWCQYLKQHHPTAFYAAQLSKVGDGKEQLYKRGKLMQDAIRHGVAISPPELGISKREWTADVGSNRVVAGLTQIHGIGRATAASIMEWYDNKSLIDTTLGLERTPDTQLSWRDLIEVKGIGPKTIAKIESFVNSEDPFGIERVPRILGAVRADIEAGNDGLDILPFPTHRSTEIPKLGNHNIVWVGIARDLNYKDYVEAKRTRTGADEADIIAEMKDPHLRKSCVVRCYDEGDEDVYIRVNRWKFPELEAALAEIKKGTDIIVVRGKKREDFGISIHVEKLWVIDGEEYE